jgi:hypothetical protein
VSQREILYGRLHIVSFAALLVTLGLLIFGQIQTRPVLPVLAVLVIALEAFRYLGRKERKRREVANG